MADIIVRISEGEIGPEGKSAYQVAVANGFTGTEGRMATVSEG